MSIFYKVIDAKTKKVLAANKEYLLFGDVPFGCIADIEECEGERLKCIFEGYGNESGVTLLMSYNSSVTGSSWNLIDVKVQGYFWDNLSPYKRVELYRSDKELFIS